MIDLSKFHFITPDDDAELYKMQCEVLSNINGNASEALLQVAILLTLPPVCDYGESVKLLKACCDDTGDIRFTIIGAWLSAEWESHQPNAFLEILNEAIPAANEHNKAVIYYLNAYDILKREQGQKSKDRCAFLFSESIRHQQDDKFFYNHYYLARISEKSTAKMLLKKSMPYIHVMSEEKCMRLKPLGLISYDSFVDEHILGISMTNENFATVQAFFNTL